MKLHPRLSRAIVELVIHFETFESHAAPTAGGGWSIGYGHTRTAREGAEVTQADAEALLLYDLSAAAELVERSTFAPLTAPQFEALTAFAFNVGPEGFRGSSALERINAGACLEAADEIERWRLAELGAGAQVVDALVRRRAAEKAHFLSLPAGASHTASARVRPMSAAAQAPGPDAPSVPSAVAAMADTVQARLRELIPDPPPPTDTPVEPSPPESEAFLTPELELQPAPTPTFTATITTPPVPEPPLAIAATMAEEPPPPPYANDADPVLDPLSEEGLDTPLPSSRPASMLAATAAAPAKGTTGAADRRPLQLERWISGLIGMIGLLLFISAVVLILRGKPDLSTVAIGAVGAVGLAIGFYGLTSPRKR